MPLEAVVTKFPKPYVIFYYNLYGLCGRSVKSYWRREVWWKMRLGGRNGTTLRGYFRFAYNCAKTVVRGLRLET